MNDGLFRTVLDGDVMAKWPAGGMFVAKDVAAEQARFDARETVHAGPMFGKKTFPAEGVGGRARGGGAPRRTSCRRRRSPGSASSCSGTRRHNLVYLDDLAAAWEPDGLRLTFTLPAGSYATVLLREVMKADVADDAGGPAEADE